MPDYLIAGFSALALALIAIPLLIPALRKLKFGQYVRQDGPQSHLAKSGTPTMGGCIFVLTIPAAMAASGRITREGFLALFLIAAMGLLGFLDDFLKIKKQHADGLSSAQKMTGQIVISLAFSTALWLIRGGKVWLPFFNRDYDLGILFIPAAIFIITATANGVNFTDGVDGLCSGVTFLVAVAFLLLCRAEPAAAGQAGRGACGQLSGFPVL